MPGIIGLTGLPRVGKDTVADILVQEFGFVKLSFAGPLKEMARRIDPIIGHDLVQEEVRSNDGVIRAERSTIPVRLAEALDAYGEDEVKARYPEYRNFLQRLGTDGIRQIDDGFWVGALRTAALEAIRKGNNVVIPDVRFPNEADTIRGIGHSESGFRLAYVARYGVVRDPNAHPAELHAGNMDEGTAIRNDGALHEFEEQVREWAGGIPWA